MDILLIIIALVFLLFASYSDIKTREVPDLMNFGLIILAFLIRAFYSFSQKSFMPLIEGFFGFGIFLVLALLLFYTGQMGGGDSKMMMGLGFLIGIPLELKIPFLADFLFNSLIFGAIYAFIWSFILGIRNYKKVHKKIKKMRKNNKTKNQFIEDVKENGLYVEAPSFSEVNIKNIINNSNNIREKVLIKKECLKYLKDKLKLELPFEMKDVYLDNIFCAPIYTMKLHKLASDIVASRDLGKCKFITKQPLKGKANSGGRRLGQMEQEGIIGHGCTRALKELLTVKSDCEEEKRNMLLQLIEDGEYNLPDKPFRGGTKRVVNTLMEFLND